MFFVPISAHALLILYKWFDHIFSNVNVMLVWQGVSIAKTTTRHPCSDTSELYSTQVKISLGFQKCEQGCFTTTSQFSTISRASQMVGSFCRAASPIGRAGRSATTPVASCRSARWRGREERQCKVLGASAWTPEHRGMCGPCPPTTCVDLLPPLEPNPLASHRRRRPRLVSKPPSSPPGELTEPPIDVVALVSAANLRAPHQASRQSLPPTSSPSSRLRISELPFRWPRSLAVDLASDLVASSPLPPSDVATLALPLPTFKK